ncbi:hypothetical protein [Methylobacterium sp. NEAU K]|uniref:hypothetical protein n=1 Tax=Methylobacterium sp. NEAU K TaxID=3064946 RepID=UPI002732B33B|nr:hypothetical protein [Methylobacterium sp. NEAU K]MDP4002182.1 hypothetical protein [Methylobacterium sp. NEAU K]
MLLARHHAPIYSPGFNRPAGDAMSDTVENATIEILKGIEARICERRRSGASTGSISGMLAMMRATAGDFDARIEAFEERVPALESRAF